MGIHREFLMIETDLANQREPVGMNAGRRQTEQYITGRNRLACDQAGFLSHADSKPSHIIFAIRIKAGHLGRLAANQGTTGLFAGPCHATDDIGDFFRLQFADRQIVKEEQRLRTLHQNVVDAHRHRILTDSIVPVHHERQFQFRSHAVRAGNQHRFGVFFHIQSE